jgi:hypothetical protein
MKTETITQRILIADDGKYLTNGETYGKTVVLPMDADATAWHEITDAEYAEIVEKEGMEDA